MIVQLSAENFIFFNRFSIDFSERLNVITGETGAGKSVLLGSLFFLLGGRPQKDLIKDPQEDFVVQGLFQWDDFDDFVPIVRVYTAKGKSKVYINGRLSTVDNLSKFLKNRVEIYTQNSLGSLFSKESYRRLIDAFLPEDLFLRFKEIYSNFTSLSRELEELRKKKENSKELRDELEGKIKEIEEISPKPGEMEELRRERELLQSSQIILETTNYIKDLISGRGSVSSLLNDALRKLDRIVSLDSRFERIRKALDDVISILSDVDLELGDISSRIEDSKGRLEEVEERFFKLKDLLLRYGGSEKEVLEKKEEMVKELEELQAIDSRIRRIEEKLNSLSSELENIAEEISARRRDKAEEISLEINREMEELGFKGGYVRFLVNRVPLSKNGIDEVRLLYKPGPGLDERPFEEVASGGERSRMALILKSLSRKLGASTMILDEIDTGIGGKVSFKVGERLKKIGEFCQVICITHQPQVAIFADKHFKVDRVIQGDEVMASIKELSEDERLKEVSRMAIGDEEVTDIAKRFFEKKH